MSQAPSRPASQAARAGSPRSDLDLDIPINAGYMIKQAFRPPLCGAGRRECLETLRKRSLRTFKEASRGKVRKKPLEELHLEGAPLRSGIFVHLDRESYIGDEGARVLI